MPAAPRTALRLAPRRSLTTSLLAVVVHLPAGLAWGQEPPPGVVHLVSSRTFATIFSISAEEPGDAFGAYVASADFFSRTTDRDLVVGAPGARPAADGGAAYGTIWAVDPDNGGLLAAMRGDQLPGGAVRRLGQSAAVLGHPTRMARAWWGLGAPDEPGTRHKGAVIVTGDEALTERYRLRGARDALFGWRVLTLGSDVDGDDPAALDFAITAPLEGRKGRREQSGSVSLHSVLTGRRIWKVRGPHRLARFGYAAWLTPDLDGDGTNDLWVGAPGSAAEGVPGAVYLLSGRDGSVLRIEPAPPGAELFGFAVAGVRDADGDSVEDLLVSAPGTPRGRRQDAGSVYLLSGADGSLLARWRGHAAGQRLGVGLGSASSLDDRRRWLLLGSALTGQGDRGRVEIYEPADRRVGSLTGATPGVRLGLDFGALHDLDGDGLIDLLVAAPAAGPLFVPE
jgi:FG-GAP repeat